MESQEHRKEAIGPVSGHNPQNGFYWPLQKLLNRKLCSREETCYDGWLLAQAV
jgi:hypothetical protein